MAFNRSFSPFALVCVALAVLGGSSALNAADIDPAKLPGVVLDEAQAELSGKWSPSVHTRPFVGQGYHHCVAGKNQRATYKLRVAETGHYHVLISYTIGSNRSDAVPVTVHTIDGPETIVINQQRKPQLNLFEPLGEFRFQAGEVSVVIDAEQVKAGVIIADAVQILTSEQLAEVKKNLPQDQPKLALDKPGAEVKPAEPAPEQAPPFVRVAPKQPLQILTPEALDSLLAKHVANLPEAPLCDDESYLRRVTLDLLGRQPKPAEIAEFAADDSPAKRAALVDRLLASPEFGTNWANYYSDVISYRTPQPELTFLNYDLFKKWLAEQLNSGTAWDEIAYRIVTASGKVAENPEVTFVGFHQADRTRLASEKPAWFLKPGGFF